MAHIVWIENGEGFYGANILFEEEKHFIFRFEDAVLQYVLVRGYLNGPFSAQSSLVSKYIM